MTKIYKPLTLADYRPISIIPVWLAQLVEALATPTHVRSYVLHVQVRFPEQTSSTLASIPTGWVKGGAVCM